MILGATFAPPWLTLEVAAQERFCERVEGVQRDGGDMIAERVQVLPQTSRDLLVTISPAGGRKCFPYVFTAIKSLTACH
jgi:hypothetical protein